jgi:hypothetical protein
LEEVRVDNSSFEMKQDPGLKRLERKVNIMKSLSASNQSTSLCGMNPGSLAVIVVMVIVALSAFFGSQSGHAQAGAVAPQLEGSWLVTVTIPDGPPPFRAIETFAAGGALVVTDGATPPSVGHVYQGTWARTGRNQFGFTFLGLQYDAAGVFSNFIRVRITLTFEPNGDAYNGVGTVEGLDPDQNVTFSADLTTHGTRINAQ